MKKEMNDYNLVAISEEEMVKVVGGNATIACGAVSKPTIRSTTKYEAVRTDMGYFFIVWHY